jgi:hypothetical protein
MAVDFSEVRKPESKPPPPVNLVEFDSSYTTIEKLENRAHPQLTSRDGKSTRKCVGPSEAMERYAEFAYAPEA